MSDLAPAVGAVSPASVRHVLPELDSQEDFLSAPPLAQTNRLVTLAAAEPVSQSPHAKPKFQPRPLPIPGQKAPRTLLTRQQEPTKSGKQATAKEKVLDSPPKLLASLHSGFAYQHSTQHESPIQQPIGSKPPSPEFRGGSSRTTRQGGKVRFGSEDLGPGWVAKAMAGGATNENSNSSTPEGHSPLGRSPSTNNTASGPKRFRLRSATASRDRERDRIVKVSHVGGKVITTISQRTVQPSASQAEADASVITTVLGRKHKTYVTIPQSSANAQSKTGKLPSPSSPDAKSPKSRSSTAPSLTWMQLRYIFFIVTVLQVGVCCGIVWYLGYRSAKETGRVLADQARAAITDHVEDVVNSYAGQILQSADALALLTTMRLPQWTMLGGLNDSARANFSIVSTPGFLADLSYILSTYPHLPLVALSSPTIHLAVRRNDTLGQHRYQIMDPAMPALMNRPNDPPNTLYEFNFDRASYYSTRQNQDEANNPRLGQSVAWFQPLADFALNDKALDMLGPVVASSLYYPATRTFVKSAVAAGTSALLWAGPVVLSASGFGHLGVAAVKPIHDSLGDYLYPPEPASGAFSLEAFTLFYLDYIRDKILVGVKKDLGESGCLFLVEGNGLLVATTLDGYTTEFQNRTQLLTTRDTFIWSMMDVLDAQLFFDPTVNPRNDTRTRQQEDWIVWEEYLRLHPNASPASLPSRPYRFDSGEPVTLDGYEGGAEVNDAHFIVGNTDWHVNARTLRLPGLDWVLIVVTQDNDFDGGLNSTKVTVGWFTALVGVLSVAASLLIAHCISRPLMRLVAFMDSVSSKLHHSRPSSSADPHHENVDQTSEELSQMCAEWKEVMMTLGGSKTGEKDAEKPSSAASSLSAEATPHDESGSSDFTDDTEEDYDTGQGGYDAGVNLSGSNIASSRFLNLSRRNSGSTMQGMLDQTIKALTPPPTGQGSTGKDGSTPAATGEPSMHAVNLTTPTIKASSPTSAPTSPTRGTLHPNEKKKKLTVRERTMRFWKNHTPACVREFPMRETQLLQHTFGSMLESLRNNHQKLQTANESKRRFIRYIFHGMFHHLTDLWCIDVFSFLTFSLVSWCCLAVQRFAYLSMRLSWAWNS